VVYRYEAIDDHGGIIHMGTGGQWLEFANVIELQSKSL
jgi:hypothetical protein